MVRVLIERRVAEGMLEDFRLALRKMRLEATQKPGYISGESLKELEDNHHLVVISTWTSPAAWRAWRSSEDRRREMMIIAPMLQEPERITVMEPA